MPYNMFMFQSVLLGVSQIYHVSLCEKCPNMEFFLFQKLPISVFFMQGIYAFLLRFDAFSIISCLTQPLKMTAFRLKSNNFHKRSKVPYKFGIMLKKMSLLLYIWACFLISKSAGQIFDSLRPYRK